MYNLVIIDDETFVLDALRDFVKYEDFGFNLSEDFSSAKEAMEYISTNKVDAVITDIRMDDGDGFSIAEFCQTNYPHIQIAFMSAYREFEYAKKALSYNAVSYITKPFIKEEFIDVLKRFYAALSKNHSTPENTFVDVDFRFDCQRLFSDLYCGIINDYEDFTQRLSLLQLDIDPGKSKAILINLHISDFNNYIANKWRHEEFRLYNAIDSIMPFFNDDFYAFTLLYSKANIEFLIISKKDINDLESKAESFLKKLKSNLSNLLNISVSADIVSVHSSLSLLINSPDTAHDTESIIHNDTFDAVMDYVNNNFSSITSISEVAKFAALSPAYFGSFFKQKTGENFNNYINKLKIEKAKKLIEQDSNKISNICYELGYNSPRYFYKMFKQYTGLTPAQYKKNL